MGNEPEHGERLVSDPRLGKRVKVLDASKKRGSDVFGYLRAIRRYADGDEIWSVACDGIVVVDGSTNNFELMDQDSKLLHWLVVGYVSPGAKQWIEEVGGQVLEVSSVPPLTAVALAYNPAGVWVWSHGRQEHRQGIEFWTTGEIQEASTEISLLYQNIDGKTLAEYSSVVDTYIILPDEEFDPRTRQVKERSAYRPEVPVEEEYSLLSLDDCPF